MKFAIASITVLSLAWVGWSQTTRPTTQPAVSNSPDQALSGDQLLDRLLKPSTQPSQLLEQMPDRTAHDKSSGRGAVKPDAPVIGLRREGTFIIDSTARLTRTQNGEAELSFESDGKALHDAPMIILPNQTLARMQDTVTASSRDLKFRITGMVTEYRGRNYILLERAVVIPDIVQQF